jgi:Transposase DDE domain
LALVARGSVVTAPASPQLPDGLDRVSLGLGDGSPAGRFGDEVVQDPSQRRRIRFEYEINAQAVVDEEHQVITAADITCNPSDALNYTEMLDQSAQNTGCRPKQALVDAGYCSETKFEAAKERQLACGHRPPRPRRTGPARTPRTHPQARHAEGTHGPKADQAR